MRTRALPATCMVGLSMLAIALLAPSAGAHSTLVEATPAVDSTVDQPPTQVVLRFSDPVDVPAGVVAVLDLAGRDHAEQQVVVDGPRVTVPLRETGPGTHVVAWNAISDHGTPISGSFVYHVGSITDGAVVDAANLPDDSGRRELTDLLRALALTGSALLGVGGLWTLVRRIRGRAIAAPLTMLAGIVAVTIAAVGTGLVVAGGDLVSGLPEPPPLRVEQQLSLGDDVTGTVTLDPAVAGAVSLQLDLRGPEGAPSTAASEAQLRYRPADERLGYFRATLEPIGDGRFATEPLIVPFPGEWEFEVTVSQDRFSSALARFRATVRPNPELDP
jgi:methionine-rich copper-binding protein CopC